MNATYTSKFKTFYRQLSVLGNFVIIQSCALLYSRKGDHSLILMIVFLLSLFLTFGLYLYWTSHNKGFAQYCFRQYWIKARTPRSRYASILMIGFIMAQFILPGNIDYYIQNILYITAFMYLISMSILIYVSPRTGK